MSATATRVQEGINAVTWFLFSCLIWFCLFAPVVAVCCRAVSNRLTAEAVVAPAPITLPYYSGSEQLEVLR